MERKNLLFILVDCFRADACYGQHRSVKTPTLDALCRQGTTFTQAVSVAGLTPVCITSIFTGVYPFIHGIRPISLNWFHVSTTRLNPSCPTLAEVLRSYGYKTYATVTGPVSYVGDLHRGFDHYVYRERKDDLYLHGKLGNDLGRLLQELRSGRDPWFLFVHLWELHAPRQVLPAFNSAEYGRTRYERAVSSLDHQLGELLQAVDFQDTVVVIHGDHGEHTDSLFEFLFHPRVYDLGVVRLLRLLYTLFFKWIHQYSFLQGSHGLSLKEHNVRVPLIFVGHPAFPEGRVIQDQVSQVDILPTLLDVLELPVNLDSLVQGRSLHPLIAGEPLAARPVYMETYSGKSVASRYVPMKPMGAQRLPRPPALVGIRTPEWKCIWVPEDPQIPTELYHLSEDPSESKNLSEERPDVAEELKTYLSVLQSTRDQEQNDR